MNINCELNVDDVLKRADELYTEACHKRGSLPHDERTTISSQQVRTLAAALVEEANAVIDVRLDEIKEWVRDNFNEK